MIEYNKLVRDAIPEIIERKGGTAHTHSVVGQEYEDLLFQKLIEESEELLSDRNAEEIADVLEVLVACAKAVGVEWPEIERLRQVKRDERGGFDRGIVLERATAP